MNRDSTAREESGQAFFENPLNLMKASDFCSAFGYSMKTVYEWKYRPKKNKVPDDLVVKFRGKLFIRTDILRGLAPFADS